MKLIKRSFAFFMSVMFLFCTSTSATSEPWDEEYPGYPNYRGTIESGCYGSESRPLEYPITGRFLSALEKSGDEDCNGYTQWYDIELASKTDWYSSLQVLSSIWGSWYSIGDPEMWPQEYLDRFDGILSNAKTDFSTDGMTPHLYDYRVDSYFFDGDCLNVRYSADFRITYRCEWDMNNYNVYRYGGDTANVYLAFRDKTDGRLVYMGIVEGSAIKPEYKYDEWYDSGELPEELEKIKDKYEYISEDCTSERSVEVRMPEFFDPEKHDVTLYFQVDYYRDPLFVYMDEYCFHDPCEILTEGYTKPDSSEDSEVTVPETTEPETTEPEVPDDPEPEIIRGDANGDGRVNLADASFMLKYIAAWDGVEVDVGVCDLNENGRVDLADVSYTLKIIAGWNV